MKQEQSRGCLWLQIITLMRDLDIGVYALNDIQQWYTMVSCTQGICQNQYVLILI
jgi:hypothetical protein